MPVWCGTTATRVHRLLDIKLPHEALAREFLNNQEAYLRARSDPSWIDVPLFRDHPVTRQHGMQHVWPVGYYTDKVKLGHTEGFYRGSCKITVMRSSITLWLLLCSQLCKCGCNGMCTVDTIQYHMNHSFKALQDKLYMASRWDMSPFHPCEKKDRAARAGREMPLMGALCEYRGDLPERCQRAGVKTQQGFYGCVAEVTLATSPMDTSHRGQLL